MTKKDFERRHEHSITPTLETLLYLLSFNAIGFPIIFYGLLQRTTAPSATGKPMQKHISPFLVAVFTLLLDQITKWVVLFHWQMKEGDRFSVLPSFDIAFVWNRGISYGLFQQETPAGRWILFGLTLVAVVILCFWIMRETSALMRTGLALIVGGAIGNGIDRAVYGAVADFVSLYFGHFAWYIFNIADAAIVAGVGILLYGSLFMKEKASPAANDAR